MRFQSDQTPAAAKKSDVKEVRKEKALLTKLPWVLSARFGDQALSGLRYFPLTFSISFK